MWSYIDFHVIFGHYLLNHWLMKYSQVINERDKKQRQCGLADIKLTQKRVGYSMKCL